MTKITIGASRNAEPGTPRDPYVSALEDEILILRAANEQLRGELAARRAADAKMAGLIAEGMNHARALAGPAADENEEG